MARGTWFIRGKVRMWGRMMRVGSGRYRYYRSEHAYPVLFYTQPQSDAFLHAAIRTKEILPVLAENYGVQLVPMHQAMLKAYP